MNKHFAIGFIGLLCLTTASPAFANQHEQKKPSPLTQALPAIFQVIPSLLGLTKGLGGSGGGPHQTCVAWVEQMKKTKKQTPPPKCEVPSPNGMVVGICQTDTLCKATNLPGGGSPDAGGQALQQILQQLMQKLMQPDQKPPGGEAGGGQFTGTSTVSGSQYPPCQINPASNTVTSVPCIDSTGALVTNAAWAGGTGSVDTGTGGSGTAGSIADLLTGSLQSGSGSSGASGGNSGDTLLQALTGQAQNSGAQTGVFPADIGRFKLSFSDSATGAPVLPSTSRSSIAHKVARTNIYEYTIPPETVNNWTRMVTVKQFTLSVPPTDADAKAISEVLGFSLAAFAPGITTTIIDKQTYPSSALSGAQSNIYVVSVYFADKASGVVETNIMRFYVKNGRVYQDVYSEQAQSSANPVVSLKPSEFAHTPFPDPVPVSSDASQLGPKNAAGDIVVNKEGVTAVAGTRDQNVEVSGFIGSNTTGFQQSQSATARLCESRPWATGFLSSIIAPSFFDGVCAWRGYNVGPANIPLVTPVYLTPAPRPAKPAAPQQPGVVTVQPASVDIWASPTAVPLGTRTSIFWKAEGGAVSCKVSGPSFTQSGLSGGSATVPISGSSTFTVVCLDASGAEAATDSVTVTLSI